MLQEAHDPTKEAGYFAQRSGFFIAGKTAAHSVGHAVADGLETALGPEVSRNLGQLGGIVAGGTLAGLTTIGLAAGVSAALTQMDYVHRRDNIKDFYKEEIAAKLGKPLNKVTVSDLELIAKNNGVINDEMKQIRKQRTFGVGLSFIASMASLAMVTLALPAIAAAAATIGIGIPLAGAAGFAISAIVGLVTYNGVKNPLHHLADKAFNLDYKTTHDHIVFLQHEREAGKDISREEVLGVFAAANPQLDRMIAQKIGRHYDNLSHDDKKLAVAEFGKFIPLDKITDGINLGKINVTELAFSVEGDISGVENGRPVAEEKKGLIKGLMTTLAKPFSRASAEASVRVDSRQLEINAIAQATSVQASQAVESDKRSAAKPFVERLGLAKRDQSMSHVERLEQGRDAQISAVVQQG